MSRDESPGGRLVSIDMLRGIAALAVVAFHGCKQGVFVNVHADKDLSYLAKLPVSFGYAGVYLFFVISGFCIHLRWARDKAAKKVSKVEFVAFWKRRLYRIYPAYAVALAIGVAFALHHGQTWDAAFTADVGSHALLVHNFRPSTLLSINPVFWTLAIEEQLYLLYFLFLWLRQRYSWTTILIASVALRIAWHALSFGVKQVGISLVVSGSALATWCIWLLGAVAVEGYYKLIELPRWTRSVPLALIVGLLTGTLALIDRLHGLTGILHLVDVAVEQLGWGFAAFIVLNAIIASESWLAVRQTRWWLYPWLWLGLVSYSLYVFHNYIFEEAHLFYLPGIVVSILVAGVAYVALERPFVRRAKKQG